MKAIKTYFELQSENVTISNFLPDFLILLGVNPADTTRPMVVIGQQASGNKSLVGVKLAGGPTRANTKRSIN